MEIIDQLIIAGMGRSGTSLLRALLSSHSKVEFYEWELNFWTVIYPKYQGKELTPDSLSNILDDMFDSYALTESKEKFTREEFEEYFNSQSTPKLENLYEYIRRRYASQESQKLFALKVPLIEFHVDSILTAYPSTRFIHMLRHPMANYRSMSEANKKWWGGKFGPMQHMFLYEKSFRYALKNTTKWPDRYMILRYEDLVESPERVIQQVCKFSGLEFEPEMMSMDKGVQWKGSNSSFIDGNESPGIYKQSVKAFQDDIPSNVAKMYKAVMMPKVSDYYPEPEKQPHFPSSLNFALQKRYLELKDALKLSIKRSSIYQGFKGK